MTSARQRTKKKQRRTQRSKSLRNPTAKQTHIGDWSQASMQDWSLTPSSVAASLRDGWGLPTGTTERHGGTHDR